MYVLLIYTSSRYMVCVKVVRTNFVYSFFVLVVVLVECVSTSYICQIYLLLVCRCCLY